MADDSTNTLPAHPLTPEVRAELEFVLDGLKPEMIDESLQECVFLIRELCLAEQYWREKYLTRTSLEIVRFPTEDLKIAND